MKKKHFLNEILSPKLLAVTWGLIIVFCVFIGFSIRGKCATSVNTTLPYSCAQYWDYNTALHNNFDVALAWARARYENIDHAPENYSILVWTTDGIYTDFAGRKGTQYTFLIEPYFRDNYSENMDYSTNSITVYSNYPVYNFYYIDAGTYSSNTGGYQANLLGNSATVDTEYGVYLPRYPFYYDGEPVLDSDGTEVIVSRVEGGVIVTGHATAPDLTGDNIGNDKPDIDNYLPTIPNMPTLDTSTVEKILESIYNILQWGFNALKGTLTGLFEYLGDLLSYSFQKVIDNIKNAIQNLYDNFVSLFEPLLNGITQLLDSISQKIDYISQPFDSESLEEAFENTAINDDIDSISQLNEQAFGTWSTTEEPNEFKIALHTEQIPLANNVNLTTTTQYIDFGVINGAKPYIRGVMWCLLTFSLLYTIIDSIPNYIGGNDE